MTFKFYPLFSHSPNNSTKHTHVVNGLHNDYFLDIFHDILLHDPGYLDELTTYLHGRDEHGVNNKLFTTLLDQKHSKVLGTANEAKCIQTMCESKNHALFGFLKTSSKGTQEKYLNKYGAILDSVHASQIEKRHNEKKVEIKSLFQKNVEHDIYLEQEYELSEYESDSDDSDPYLQSESSSSESDYESELDEREVETRQAVATKHKLVKEKPKPKRSLFRRR